MYKYPALYAVCAGIGVLAITKSPTLSIWITKKSYKGFGGKKNIKEWIKWGITKQHDIFPVP